MLYNAAYTCTYVHHWNKIISVSCDGLWLTLNSTPVYSVHTNSLCLMLPFDIEYITTDYWHIEYRLLQSSWEQLYSSIPNFAWLKLSLIATHHHNQMLFVFFFHLDITTCYQAILPVTSLAQLHTWNVTATTLTWTTCEVMRTSHTYTHPSLGTGLDWVLAKWRTGVRYSPQLPGWLGKNAF